jgi:uncharacterized damage-inducible protein DinB
VAESFVERDLKGARFNWVDLTSASFELVYLRDASFASVDLSGARIRNSAIKDVVIDGEVESLTINGIDVVPLIEAELDRRHPERLKLRPTDADGFRAAWIVIQELWRQTIAWARTIEPSLLHEQVNGEWSFIETLRHLVFATDSWIGRAILGDPSPWHPLALPWDQMPDIEGVPRDRAARPSLDEVLALRADRMATVERVLADLTDEQLADATTPVEGVGWPPPESFPVREVLMTVLNEEWWHRQFAERDLAALAAR